MGSYKQGSYDQGVLKTRGSYKNRFLQQGVSQQGVLTTKGLITRGSYNQGSYIQEFL